MLYDVAALVSSVALGPVAEAFGVHEIAQHSIVVSLEHAPEALPFPLPVAPLPFIGPEPDAALGESSQGALVLLQLSSLEPWAIPGYVNEHPDAIAEVLAAPPAPQSVAVWWDSMRLDARNILRTSTPELVGNLDGVPYAVRDVANRQLLGSTIIDLEFSIANEPGRTIVENAKQQLNMLQSISGALGDASTGDARRTLLSLDVTGQGRAAIVVGDLVTADYVTYMVPGMFFTIEGQMTYWTDAAARLRDEQLSWKALFGDTDSTVATVAWIGYHTPNLTNVGGIENAEEARDSLASTIEGLQAIRGADEPYVTVIAHSYGSTAALMALTEDDFDIDALAVVGSPGSPAQSVDELHVKNHNVYVGEAAWDPVPNSAFFGSDPGAESYGARGFGTDGGVDPITGDTLTRSFFHIEYFSPGTESLRNLALISSGLGEYVSPR